MCVPLLSAPFLLIASFVTRATAFTPKDSAHCLRWTKEPPRSVIRAEGIHANGTEPTLCRLVRANGLQDLNQSIGTCPFASTKCGVTVGAQSAHVDIGRLVDSSTDRKQECLPIAFNGIPVSHDSIRSSSAIGPEMEYIVADPTCDVWWREVSADVIPPIPELMLSLGVSPQGHRLGLCRTFGDDPSVDGGHKIVGTLAQEGPDYGRCFFTRAEGTQHYLDGGMFHVLQARAAEPSCVDDPELRRTLSLAIEQRLENFFGPEDRRLLEKVVGSSLTSFAELQREISSLGSCDLKQVLSAARFVPHQLNVKGLHVLRCLLAERMGDARARARGFDRDKDYVDWKERGVLIKDFDSVGDEGLHHIMQLVLGEVTTAIPKPPYNWVSRNVTMTGDWDPQNDWHVDTFSSVVKIWLFESDVSLNEGPLMLSPGSHRNDEGRLRWMHAYSLPPATEALTEPSFRLLGSESAIAAAPGFVKSVLRNAMPVLPLPGVRWTLVVGDTTGLHQRGIGNVGHKRRSWRLQGDTDGGLKRLDPYRLPHGFKVS